MDAAVFAWTSNGESADVRRPAEGGGCLVHEGTKGGGGAGRVAPQVGMMSRGRPDGSREEGEERGGRGLGMEGSAGALQREVRWRRGEGRGWVGSQD